MEDVGKGNLRVGICIVNEFWCGGEILIKRMKRAHEKSEENTWCWF